jgi:MFS family permease
VSDYAPTLFSPIVGTISDRLDRKLVMLGCEFGRGIIVTLIVVFDLPNLFFLALVGISSVIGQLFGAASRSAIPALVEDDDLESANAALGLGTNGLDLIGPVLAAFLLPFFNIRGLLLIDAATYFVAVGLLLGLPRLAGAAETEETPKTSFWRDTKEGLTYLWQNRPIRLLTIGFFAVVLFNAVDDVALVFLAKDSLHATDSEASLLYAGAGAGLLVGFALLSRFGSRFSSVTMLLIGYAVSSTGNGLTGLAWAIPVAFGLQAIRGLGLSLMDLANNTLIQRLVPAHLLGRVFGNVYGAVGLAAGLSYVLGGFLLTFTNPRFVLIVAGAGGLTVTLLIALMLPEAMRQAHTEPTESSVTTSL